MLPAFLRPSAGRVMFVDINISNLDVDLLRDHVTNVFQEHTLLSELLRNNLLRAKPDAGEAGRDRWRHQASLQDRGLPHLY